MIGIDIFTEVTIYSILIGFLTYEMVKDGKESKQK